NVNIDRQKNWYKHSPTKVSENENGKILWDFRIQTDRRVEYNTPDIVLIEKNHIQIIDIAIPGDARIAEKETEKIQKYQELGREMARLWQRRTFKVIPIVVGAMGTITPNLEKYLKELGISELSTGQLQKSAVFGTTQIIKKYLRNS
ncbi:MAG: hypothetical protein KTM48_00480, partial [Wolbachia endosymbiont of Pissodes strobi]|nr:hypothetical protein [Wolbachia endosymbiont of Pissodes strobi]